MGQIKRRPPTSKLTPVSKLIPVSKLTLALKPDPGLEARSRPRSPIPVKAPAARRLTITPRESQ